MNNKPPHLPTNHPIREETLKSLAPRDKISGSLKRWGGKVFSFFDRLKFQLPARFSTKDQAHFSKRLSFLIHAGVPIVESLRILRRQTKSKRKAIVYDKLISDVSNGQFLATSLAKLKYGFSNFAVNIIKTGETSGTLDQNLNYLAEELKKKRALQQKVVSAFIYPIFITVATLGLTGLLTAFIFPKIRPIFESLHVELPLSTKILIWASDFLINDGLYLIMGTVLGVIGITLLIKKVKPVRFFVHRWILIVPLIGSIVQNYIMANFCRTLGLLLKGGVRITEAITITGDTMTNVVYQKELTAIAHGVLKGEKISQHLLRRPHLFPDLLTQMISIGESTGNLTESLTYLSEMYEHEVDELTKNLSSTLEPVLMIFMGLLVGFVAVSVITPIYNITQNLHR